MEQYDTDEGSEVRGSSPLDPDLRDGSPLDPSLVAVQELLRSQLPPQSLASTGGTKKLEEGHSSLAEDGVDPRGRSEGAAGIASSSGGVTSSHGSVSSSSDVPSVSVPSVAIAQKQASHDPGSKAAADVGVTPTGVLPTGRESWSETNSDADDAGREILKDIEQAVMKSSVFIKEFSRLADSGSSDPDSDNDRRSVPYRRKQHQTVPPRVAHKFMEQVKQIATPTPVEIHTVHLVKAEGFADFGFSVSDGLVEPGIYVRAIKHGGLADMSGKLAPFDRILKVSHPLVVVWWSCDMAQLHTLQINHHVVKDLDCKGAVPILAGTGNEVTLVVSRNPFANKEWDEEV